MGSAWGNTFGFLGRISFQAGTDSDVNCDGDGSNGISRIVVSNTDVEYVSFKL